MALPIAAYGHPFLRRRATEISKDYPGLDDLIDNMFETMYESVGVGLAAPQVNKSIRLFVVDTSPYKEEYPEAADFKQVFINPTIVEETGKKWEYKEACLSFPGIAEYVSRKEKLKIQYYDREFEHHEAEYDGVLARVIQHEYDHLEGILFIDKINPLSRTLLRKKLNEIKSGKVETSYQMIFADKKIKIKNNKILKS